MVDISVPIAELGIEFELDAGKGAGLSGRAGAVARGRRAVSPFLDSLSVSPMAAWGFVKMLSTYAGPCCRVRRESDNAELDIGFLSDGVVDTDLMFLFSAGSSLRLVTMYDQSGAALNLAQAVAGTQPLVDLEFLRNGMPRVLGNTTSRLDIPAGVAITSTQNCAVWAAVGDFSQRRTSRPWNFGTDGQFTLGLSPSSAYSVQPRINNSYVDFGTIASVPNSNGAVVGLNSSASALTFYRNDQSFTRAAVTSISTTGGVWPSTISEGIDLFGTVVFNAALSAEDAARIQYGMTRAYACVLSPKAQVVISGDSIVASATSAGHNYSKVLNYYLPVDVAIYSMGLGGNTMNADIPSVQQRVSNLYKPGIPNIHVNLYGVNDITAGRTSADIIDDIQTWHASTSGAGFITMHGILYPRAVTGSYTEANRVTREEVNDFVRSNYGEGKLLDGIVDFNLEPTFLPTISTSDFPDNLHPNLGGYLKATPVLAKAIIAKLPGV